MTALTRALRRKSSRRIAAVGVVAAGALVLSACSDNGDDMSGMDHGSTASATATAEPGKSAAAEDFNDADVTFAQMMIPHHEQALEMAKLADGRASDSEIKELAAQIEKAQDPEIKTMQGWLKSWGKPTEMESMPGMDHSSHSGMDGMMSDEDMEELKAAKGTDFDKMFAEMMIEHHNGAIAMAEDEQKNGKNADAKKMADAIVEGQSAEVEQLQSILDRL
ncbi:DUF305 domain-containing protein [Streptomyces jeddahensis]|uniref:DUF305 domain-containing protein n=1 Tax=Streptomyces jeddahensis TaxID=1716141 RepID=A0A177HRG2_9ACTN|nr:DUF305 domain-containing protein [Streptomyces jeddahensis]OAH12794.1 hypothetical protein STSP_38310 [Streptomyces jeddahensis]